MINIKIQIKPQITPLVCVVTDKAIMYWQFTSNITPWQEILNIHRSVLCYLEFQPKGNNWNSTSHYWIIYTGFIIIHRISISWFSGEPRIWMFNEIQIFIRMYRLWKSRIHESASFCNPPGKNLTYENEWIYNKNYVTTLHARTSKYSTKSLGTSCIHFFLFNLKIWMSTYNFSLFPLIIA